MGSRSKLGSVMIVVVAGIASAFPCGAQTSTETAQPETKWESPSASGSNTRAEERRTTRAGIGNGAVSRFALGFKASLLGGGVEAGYLLTPKSNLRFGYNLLNYDTPVTHNGINYLLHVRMRSAEALFDWFPFGHSFHVSPGILMYDGNRISATASVPGGQSFILGSTSYVSSQSDPVHGTGQTNLNRYAPMVLVGWGNFLPRTGRHFSFTTDLGVAYQGSPGITLQLQGSVCDPSGLVCSPVSVDPTIPGSIRAELNKLNHGSRLLQFYPLISFGVGYRF